MDTHTCCCVAVSPSIVRGRDAADAERGLCLEPDCGRTRGSVFSTAATPFVAWKATACHKTQEAPGPDREKHANEEGVQCNSVSDDSSTKHAPCLQYCTKDDTHITINISCFSKRAITYAPVGQRQWNFVAFCFVQRTLL